MINKTVLCYGELLWDLMPFGEILGGPALNFAYRLHGLGDEAVPVSRLGEDRRGHAARRDLGALGLPLHLVQADSNRDSGTVLVSFENGQPRYVIVEDVAHDYIECDQAVLAAAATADCVYFGTLAQRNDQARQTLYRLLDAAPQALKFLDINLRKECYAAGTVRESIARADIVKLNDEEVEVVAELIGLPSGSVEEFAGDLLQNSGVACCIVTFGADGVRAFSSQEGEIRLPGIAVEVADTIGAGDAFSAGFVHAYLQTGSVAEAARFGNILGALAASKPGASSPISQAEIEAMAAAAPLA